MAMRSIFGSLQQMHVSFKPSLRLLPPIEDIAKFVQISSFIQTPFTGVHPIASVIKVKVCSLVRNYCWLCSTIPQGLYCTQNSSPTLINRSYFGWGQFG